MWFPHISENHASVSCGYATLLLGVNVCAWCPAVDILYSGVWCLMKEKKQAAAHRQLLKCSPFITWWNIIRLSPGCMTEALVSHNEQLEWHLDLTQSEERHQSENILSFFLGGLLMEIHMEKMKGKCVMVHRSPQKAFSKTRTIIIEIRRVLLHFNFR